MAKYTTLKELSDAFKSGKLDPSYWLMIDKGGNSLTLCQSPPDGVEDNAQLEVQRDANCESIFKWEYQSPLDELFSLAGIPVEHP